MFSMKNSMESGFLEKYIKFLVFQSEMILKGILYGICFQEAKEGDYEFFNNR